ncbi:MAG: RnfABCDGE type electron transport complex subunit B [Candidatus Izemoplasma sp.]|jgi:electron transport complex protein RnfB
MTIIIILSVALSLTLALILSFASTALEVEEDPRLQDVLDMLPNANCGACGNPGCKAMAEAILGNDARLTQCKPGDQDMREDIRDYLNDHPNEDGEFVKVKM